MVSDEVRKVVSPQRETRRATIRKTRLVLNAQDTPINIRIGDQLGRSKFQRMSSRLSNAKNSGGRASGPHVADDLAGISGDQSLVNELARELDYHIKLRSESVQDTLWSAKGRRNPNFKYLSESKRKEMSHLGPNCTKLSIYHERECYELAVHSLAQRKCEQFYASSGTWQPEEMQARVEFVRPPKMTCGLNFVKKQGLGLYGSYFA